MFKVKRIYEKPAPKDGVRILVGGEKIHGVGFLYAFIPAGLGALVLLIVAILVNNIPRNRNYPEFWF